MNKNSLLSEFQKRIDYTGDIADVLISVCGIYGLGEYTNHNVILNGYEDYNVVLETDVGKFFVKIFGAFRSYEDCKRCVDIMRVVLEAGVSHPQLHTVEDKALYVDAESGLRLVVMEYIIGKTYFDRQRPTKEEVQEITRQAALVNMIDYQPELLRDSWAIPCFLEEYNAIKNQLPNEDIELIEPLVENFEINHNELPKAFVHADLIRPNIMREKNGSIYLIDFSVANYYPRIYELAWLLCNVFFDAEDDKYFEENYVVALDEYQKQIKLTERERAVLPYFIQVAHAMHVIGASREKILNGNTSEENEFWLAEGRAGLQYMLKRFSGK